MFKKTGVRNMTNCAMVIMNPDRQASQQIDGFSPKSTDITDVPDDQGRWVSLSWLASALDPLGQIARYGVWELDPEDKWVSLGNVPAIQEDYYTFVAPTFGDSTGDGIQWSKFMISAHEVDPNNFYKSEVDSGYSVDNLAPAAPTGLLAFVTDGSEIGLTWDAPVDEDFKYFAIYRSLEAGFDPTGLAPYTETISINFTDTNIMANETYYYRLSAFDENGNQSEFSVEVNAILIVNLPPVQDPIGDKTVNEGELLEFSVTANDPDGDTPLNFSATGLPPGATFDASGVFSYSPGFDVSTSTENTSFSVNFEVSDGNGGTDSETVLITVLDVNIPPVLDPIGDKIVSEGELLEFSVTANDPDGVTPLSFSATGLPSGASFDASGSFSYSPGFDVSTSTVNASFSVNFEVADADGGTDSKTVIITVLDVAGGTSPGDNVAVEPVDSETGTSPVSLTFSKVTSGGETTLTTSGTGQPPPSGFKLGSPPVYYDISTTASFSPSVEVCINYTGISFDGKEEKLKLFHFEDSDGDGIDDSWVKPTVSSHDIESNIICVSVASLSPFAIFEPLPGVITGTVSANSAGLSNVTVELLNNEGSSVDGFSPIPTGSLGDYSFTDVIPETYQVIIVEPLGYSVDANPKLAPLAPGGTTTVDFALTEVVLSNNARGMGYWKHQFNVYVNRKGKAQESAEDLTTYIGRVHQVYTPYFDVFSGKTSLDDWQSVLTVKKKGSMLDRAKQQLAALLLNFASLKIGQYEVVTEDGHTVGDVLTFVSNLITGYDVSNDELAKDLAEMVNNHEEIGADLVPTGSKLYKVAGASIDWSFLPTEFALHNNYPNPFNPVTTLSYDLPMANNVRIVIYNLMGQEIRRWEFQAQTAGYHKVVWDASRVASGIYFYRIKAGDFIKTRKMLLLK